MPAGDLVVVVTCPRCGERADVFAHLSARLTVTEEGGAVRAVLKTKPVDHTCGQMRLEPAADPLTDPLFAEDGGRDRRRSGER